MKNLTPLTVIAFSQFQIRISSNNQFIKPQLFVKCYVYQPPKS